MIQERSEVIFHHVEAEWVLLRELTLDEDIVDQELFEHHLWLELSQVPLYVKLLLVLSQHFVNVLKTLFVKWLVQLAELFDELRGIL